MTRPWREWAPDWSGKPCVIVASGPSAAEARVSRARDRCRVLAVNESWRLCPWADALYAHDHAWWRLSEGRRFEGLRIAGERRAADDYGLDHVRVLAGDHRILVDEPGVIGSGGNSGFQALNLAVQFGAKRISLVGFDMSEAAHWHGKHRRGLSDPSTRLLAMWRKWLDAAAPQLDRLGVEVTNANPRSALTAYRKEPLEALWN